MAGEGTPHRSEAVSDQRVQSSLLSGPEKAALHWIAPRLPRWVGPDLLTFVGLVALLVVGAAYYMVSRLPDQRWLFLIIASAALVVNWFGDSLDGTVARVRKMQRPMYGYYLDHLVDAFGTSAVLLGLAWSGLMSEKLGALLLALYLIASINVYLATHAVGEFKISFARISPTEGRVLLICLNTVLIFWTEAPITVRTHVRILDAIGCLGGVLLFALILRSAVPNLLRLDRAERARWTTRDASETAGASAAESGGGQPRKDAGTP